MGMAAVKGMVKLEKEVQTTPLTEVMAIAQVSTDAYNKKMRIF